MVNACDLCATELRARAGRSGGLVRGVGRAGRRAMVLQVFSMRSMVGGAAFHRAYHRATQQAFFETHEHAFQYFQGVFRVLRYDNLTSAVECVGDFVFKAIQ